MSDVKEIKQQLRTVSFQPPSVRGMIEKRAFDLIVQLELKIEQQEKELINLRKDAKEYWAGAF